MNQRKGEEVEQEEGRQLDEATFLDRISEKGIVETPSLEAREPLRDFMIKGRKIDINSIC